MLENVRQVRICRPAKSAMQSGRATQGWVLQYDSDVPRRPDALMGWTSGDTLPQVKLRFTTQEEAIAYAVARGWEYQLIETQSRVIKPRSYMDNFRKAALQPAMGDGTSA